MRKVLVVAPHPDDEVLGCGGTIAKHTADGDEVHVLVVTRGAPELYTSDEVEYVRSELRAAHDVLRVEQTHFLDFPAPLLDTVPESEIASGIQKVIRLVNPEFFYIPHRGDIHVDHRVVHRASLVASRPIEGCSVRSTFAYETLSETEWAIATGSEAFIPDVFNDISAHLRAKIEALRCYESQIKPSPHPRSLRAIESLAHFRGSTISRDAAEAFALVRHIID